MRKSYLRRVLIAFDQLLNVVFLNGSEHQTISGRVGYKALTTGKKRWCCAEKIINTLFFLDKDHCKSSIYSPKEKDKDK
jgi:hypothetical protein